MYFDRRLWQLMRGARGRIAAAVAIGLAASAIGIARFVFLGWLLALVFTAAPPAALVLPTILVAGAVLLRGWLEHVRTMVANRTACAASSTIR
jgi:ATP-binding cassette, subfamily B, bacterial